jgi:hypothetical protein
VQASKPTAMLIVSLLPILHSSCTATSSLLLHLLFGTVAFLSSQSSRYTDCVICCLTGVITVNGVADMSATSTPSSLDHIAREWQGCKQTFTQALRLLDSLAAS